MEGIVLVSITELDSNGVDAETGSDKKSAHDGTEKDRRKKTRAQVRRQRRESRSDRDINSR